MRQRFSNVPLLDDHGLDRSCIGQGMHSRRSSLSASGRWHDGSLRRQKERQEWLRKYSPLSSSDLFHGVRSPTSVPPYEQLIEGAIDPNGKFAYNWLAMVSLAVTYYSWSMILRTAFEGVQEGFGFKIFWMVLDILCSIIYGIDIYIHLYTGYLRNGILESDSKRLLHHYISSWPFYIDVLSALPIDIIETLLPYQFNILLGLKWLRLLKSYRLREFHNFTENRTHYPHACRFLFLMHNLLLTIHWNACIYFILSKHIGLGSDQWVFPHAVNISVSWDDLVHQYIYCFYWSTLTLTTIGGHPLPEITIEFVFITIDYLVGILMFATLVGNVGGIISNMQKVRTKFQAKLDSVKSYMRTMAVPNHLQERVVKWFDYLWTHGHPVDDQTVLHSLPDKLKAEIGIHVHYETLKKVDFFDHCDHSLLWELVLRLHIQVYSPGDYVCRKGDVGREMYIVSHGKLEVLEEEDKGVLHELKHGDYFGEISVLNLGSSHNRRTAFVRSVGYSDLLCLSQSDLLDVLSDYPQAMNSLREKGRKKLGIEFPEEEDVESDSGYYYGENYVIEEERERKLSTPISYGDIRHLTDQLLDLQIKISELEDVFKELVQEVRKKSRGTQDSDLLLHEHEVQIVLTPPRPSKIPPPSPTRTMSVSM